MILSTLRLFNAVQIEKRSDSKEHPFLERTIKHGFIIDPSILVDEFVLSNIEKVIGISGEKANAAFHKSWAVVKDFPIEQLVIQQIMHYITTYGFEAMGIYDDSLVYIPHEELEVPEIKINIPLVYVRGLTNEEILTEILKLSTSGIALAEETLNDIMAIVEANKYPAKNILSICENRELCARIADLYDIAPGDPVGYLRYVISKLTNESLLIKNKYLIGKIKEANGKFLDTLLKDAPDDLASIFYRYKPIFLAMKSISKNKHFFNQLRKNAPKMHKPVREDYLSTTTSRIKKGNFLLKKLESALEKASIFRKIRLAYALSFRANNPGSIVYRVRNGRGWATELKHSSSEVFGKELIIGCAVCESIAENLKEKLSGKTIYIPEHIDYALPATEKQFVGNFPSGTAVKVLQDLIVGVYWKDNGRRTDLDLAFIDTTGKKFGWDGSYRDSGHSILFSGDMTSASKGASELFYISSAVPQTLLLSLNHFNYSKGDTTECKIIVAHEQPGRFNKNYMVDPNNIVAQANITISKKQNIIGLVKTVNGCLVTYFTNVAVGNSISSSANRYTFHTLEYLTHFYGNPINMTSILSSAGATVTSEKPEDEEFIDLSPEAINKTTFINLLKG